MANKVPRKPHWEPVGKKIIATHVTLWQQCVVALPTDKPIRTYDDLREFICARRDAMQVSNQWLDQMTGIADGYSGKALCNPPMRRLMVESLLLYLAPLGLTLQFAEDPEAVQRYANRVVIKSKRRQHGSPTTTPIVQVIRRSFLRKIGRKGGLQRKKNFDADARRRLALSKMKRAAALKRWHKPKIEEVSGLEQVEINSFCKPGL
jgi:hypothetical protein